MTRVITYGTYDMLHFGHIRLLKRAKALGDYLIVGVTSDDYDKTRGKINNQQSLMERISAIKETGIADEIIVEEYEGQKIDDIRRLDVDIFTVGSDWEGVFDYLNEYCKVIYLPRTDGISSTKLRTESRRIKLGIIGNSENRIINKYINESKYVNGLDVSGICTCDNNHGFAYDDIDIIQEYDELLSLSDAIYVISHPSSHYEYIKKAINAGKHVLVELPFALTREQHKELAALSDDNNVIMMPAMKTAYATAYNRLLLLVKGGKIGNIVSVDATCTSMREVDKNSISEDNVWNSICAWGPTALLPVFQILGTSYYKSEIVSKFINKKIMFDGFTKIDFIYDNAVASIKVGRSVKSEGDLVISGTEGYFYVPSPWWKTDYFELRRENPEENQRYYYHLDGEGIRYELVDFVKAIRTKKQYEYIGKDISLAITEIIEKFYDHCIVEIE